MCGINGILRLADTAPPVDPLELRRTRDAMAKRGPDAAAEWIAPTAEIAFGHRRLAIIDLTEAGGQPMRSADGRYRLVTNGEIYNYRELRRELERDGIELRSQSDTEVLLWWVARHGVPGLRRLRGMYAFAFWDAAERTLLLARDPFGIKPLYYCIVDGTLRFASQVKALDAGRQLAGSVDPAGLCGFLVWGSVPEPFTIRAGVRALAAGHVLQVRDGVLSGPQRFQGIDEAPDDDTVASIETALADSVAAHLVSDVPLGIFLSAGLDSAMLAALAVRALPEPPTTLTVAFDEFADTADDEAPVAREVAKALGTRHFERRVHKEEMLALWPALLHAMDQPSIDGANTYLVCRAAREAGLTVAISGLGGDEMFGSYPSFRDVPRWSALAQRLRRLPGAAAAWPAVARLSRRPKLAGLMRHGATLAGAYFLRRGLFLPEELRSILPPALADQGLAELTAAAEAGEGLPIDGRDPTSIAGTAAPDSWLAVHRLECRHYLRNQLLRDTDWASMAHSLEVRVPLVDVRLHAALARHRFEPARSQGKAELVRQVAHELPASVLDRTKSGFRIPLQHWLPVATRAKGGARSRQLALRLLDEWSLPLPEMSERSGERAAVTAGARS